MNHPSLAQVPTLQDWLQATRRIISTLPLQPLGRRSAALAPPRTRSAGRSVESTLEQEDWDLMFRAVLERLASVATEKAAPHDGALRLQPPGTLLRECIDTLDQLRRRADFT